MSNFDKLVIPSPDEYMNTFAGDIGNFSFACFEVFAYHTKRRLKQSTESLKQSTESLNEDTARLSDLISDNDDVVNRAEEFLERNPFNNKGDLNE